jgi:hypothetical protein
MPEQCHPHGWAAADSGLFGQRSAIDRADAPQSPDHPRLELSAAGMPFGVVVAFGGLRVGTLRACGVPLCVTGASRLTASNCGRRNVSEQCHPQATWSQTCCSGPTSGPAPPRRGCCSPPHPPKPTKPPAAEPSATEPRSTPGRAPWSCCARFLLPSAGRASRPMPSGRTSPPSSTAGQAAPTPPRGTPPSTPGHVSDCRTNVDGHCCISPRHSSKDAISNELLRRRAIPPRSPSSWMSGRSQKGWPRSPAARDCVSSQPERLQRRDSLSAAAKNSAPSCRCVTIPVHG